MSDRLNLVVEDGIPELLTALAGGERRRGQWLSDLVKAMNETETVLGSDVDVVKLALGGLAGQVKGIDARVIKVEQTLAALMASDRRLLA